MPNPRSLLVVASSILPACGASGEDRVEPRGVFEVQHVTLAAGTGPDAPALGGHCLLAEPLVDPASQPVCAVLELGPPGCACDPSRGLAPPSAADAALVAAAEPGDACVCAVSAVAEGDPRARCEQIPGPTGDENGFCYVDPARAHGTDAVVAVCPETRKRLLRLVGAPSQPGASPRHLAFVCRTE